MKGGDEDYKRLQPLDIKCTSADCDNDLHCFLQTKKMRIRDPEGRCRYCAAKLVDWARTHECNIADVAYTFDALKFELIRHFFWHVRIDDKALIHARKKGMSGLRAAAEKRLISSVSKALPFHDGYQTPRAGNILYYAQHATATCCRRCIEEWHGIPLGQPLNGETLAYFTELLMLYVKERLPDLKDEGEYIPRTRRILRDGWL